MLPMFKIMIPDVRLAGYIGATRDIKGQVLETRPHHKLHPL